MIAPSEESQDGHPVGTSAGPVAGSAPADGAGTDDPEIEASAAERVVFFSDAVVAIAITLLALVQIIASACLLLISREIARADLLRPGAPESARHPDHAPSLAIIVAFLVSIPVSFFTG